MDVFEWIMFIMVSIYTLSMIYLLLFGLINSLKSPMDYNGVGGTDKNIFGWPRMDEKYGGAFLGLRFQTYVEMLRDFRIQITPLGQGIRFVYIEEQLLNTLVYAVAMSFATIMTQVMVAYAVAKYDFKLKSVIYNTAVIVMLIPIVGSLASEVRFADFFNLKDSVLGVCILRCKFTGMYFLVFYATFKSVSWTYAEAAMIDGAGHLQIFIQIMLPLVMNSIFAVFILQFIANWNDYFTPMIFIPNKPTIAYGLYSFQFDSRESIFVPHKLAASLFSSFPIIVLFIIFRNKIMGNVRMGGIKG